MSVDRFRLGNNLRVYLLGVLIAHMREILKQSQGFILRTSKGLSIILVLIFRRCRLSGHAINRCHVFFG